ncbi:CRISPR-associated helicase Cas3' [Endozoicomonas sp. SESOKO1]|uniref:CRISPR-associated helicase Cas3' n=1 Tax=Endozoicomonas sp. SESOKO1 TaxID=2828742 RepID=UPI0021486891|nr:CRISPR-associated helicase Cas3' [Endozoicomonas sp. SESOKO1]
MDFFRYWGKARGTETAGSLARKTYHLLAYHSLDVAATGWLLLNPGKPLCRQLARQLSVQPQWLQTFFCFCLMLHDIGKFCRGFQNLAPNLSLDLVPAEPQRKYDTRHDSLGYLLWQKELSTRLADLFPDRKIPRAISPWLEVVCGHHGQPPRKDRIVRTCLNPEEDIPAAEAFVRNIVSYWQPDFSPLTSIDKKVFKKVSWQLAGVAVLADWLGSDQSVFGYQERPMPLQDYWQSYALPAAEKVVSGSALQPGMVNPFTSIRQQFDFIHEATPLQEFAEVIDLGDSPHLFILEDVTGAGKTEAAMVLVHRLMAAGLADGLYVGLPTMATANGMYQRLANSYQALFQKGAKPSLVLAHGASQLSGAFQSSIGIDQHKPDKSYQPDDLSASAYCHQWLADSRKKALLADVGVGTIDQALLAVLPARHQSLRMLGLGNKVLLVDEVHAYDPYMRQLLISLLQAHAAQGGSIVLLSATLPLEFRSELVAAYLKGRGFAAPALQEEGYPLATYCCDQGLQEKVIATRSSVKRTVKVKRLASEAEALELIRKTAQAGQSICWIRNTVRDARSAYNQLQQEKSLTSDRLSLFHSRFTVYDRQVIESDVLNRFGKYSEGEQRTGQILIATQVVEQSLDLDFDVMISDLAPVDLLIQRAGRLQRHIRNASGSVAGVKDQRPAPVLYLLSPDPDKIDSEHWLRTLLPGSQAVYANVGQLWLTAGVMLQDQGFSMPEDARHLIESVYGKDVQECIPEVLQQASSVAVANDRARTSMGHFNCLDLQQGYTWGSGGAANGWDEDTRIPTRLNDIETVTVVLAKVDGNGDLQPWVANENPDHAWALSQIRLPEGEWRKAEALIPPQWQTPITELKQRRLSLKWLEILPLVAETGHLYQSESGWDLARNNDNESD